MSQKIVVAVDAKERTLDALALGRVLVQATGAPAVLVSVLPHDPLEDPASPQLSGAREDVRALLTELADAEGLGTAEAEVIPGNFAARALQRVTERPDAGLIVVGSTTRGPIGRLLIGGIGERLLTGAACPVATAPRGYAERAPARLSHIGVGFDASEEAQRALEAAVALARAAGGARITVITAFQPMVFGGIGTSALPSRSVNRTLEAELRAAHDEAVTQAGSGLEAEGLFRHGTSGDVLIEAGGHVDLLVVGSRGYGPLGAVLLGSTSTAVMQRSACPVLVTQHGTRFDLSASP